MDVPKHTWKLTEKRRRTLEEEKIYLDYWQSRTPEERVAAVEVLRARKYGWTGQTRPRMQKVMRIVKMRIRVS